MGGGDDMNTPTTEMPLETAMSESEALPPSPFAPVPIDPRERAGCRKAALGGCAFLILLFGVAAVWFVTNAPEVLRWGLGLSEQQLSARIAADVPAPDRARLRAAFAAARASLGTRSDPQALSAFQAKMLDLSKKKELGREDVVALAETLERLAGPSSPASPPSPPSSTPSAEP